MANTRTGTWCVVECIRTLRDTIGHEEVTLFRRYRLYNCFVDDTTFIITYTVFNKTEGNFTTSNLDQFKKYFKIVRTRSMK